MAAPARTGLVLLAALVLAGCGSLDPGIEQGGKLGGKTLTVYSLTPDPDGASRDMVDGQKLALSDARGRIHGLIVNFASLDLGRGDSAAAEATRRAIEDPQIIAAVVDATPVTVPLLNAAGILQVAPGGDATPGRRRQRQPVRAPHARADRGARRARGLRPALPGRVRARARRAGAHGLPGDARRAGGDHPRRPSRQRPHAGDRRVLQSSSAASSVISGTAASAFESGQFSFAP